MNAMHLKTATLGRRFDKPHPQRPSKRWAMSEMAQHSLTLTSARAVGVKSAHTCHLGCSLLFISPTLLFRQPRCKVSSKASRTWNKVKRPRGETWCFGWKDLTLVFPGTAMMDLPSYQHWSLASLFSQQWKPDNESLLLAPFSNLV